jgi:hypothetical protein
MDMTRMGLRRFIALLHLRCAFSLSADSDQAKLSYHV